jgi:hypothetical protein
VVVGLETAGGRCQVAGETPTSAAIGLPVQRWRRSSQMRASTGSRVAR